LYSVFVIYTINRVRKAAQLAAPKPHTLFSVS
jgi:hypothetical protein